MLTKDTAICIRTTDYSETSQVVTLFARAAGKIDAIAKGSKRGKSAFGGPLELFSSGGMVFSDSGKDRLATLTEFVPQADMSGLTSNQFSLNCAYLAIELVNSLTQSFDPHPELFDGLSDFLRNIQDAQKDSDRLILLILFQLTLLKEVGLQPVLQSCVNCKSKFSVHWSSCHFSSSANGVVCMDCEGNYPDKLKLSKEAANALSNFRLLFESGDKIGFEIEKILLKHFTETIGRPLKMAKYIV